MAAPRKKKEAVETVPLPEPVFSFGPYETYTEVETPSGTFGLASGEVVQGFADPEVRGGFVVRIGRI